MRLSRIRRGSFRGVSIYVPDDTERLGRNVIEHLYPDSNMRWLEDNGMLLSDYELQCVVPDDQISALRAAVTRPGPGTLIHPWLGRVRASVMGHAEINRSDEHLGWFDVLIPLGKQRGSSITIGGVNFGASLGFGGIGFEAGISLGGVSFEGSIGAAGISGSLDANIGANIGVGIPLRIPAISASVTSSASLAVSTSFASMRAKWL